MSMRPAYPPRHRAGSFNSIRLSVPSRAPTLLLPVQDGERRPTIALSDPTPACLDRLMDALRTGRGGPVALSLPARFTPIDERDLGRYAEAFGRAVVRSRDRGQALLLDRDTVPGDLWVRTEASRPYIAGRGVWWTSVHPTLHAGPLDRALVAEAALSCTTERRYPTTFEALARWSAPRALAHLHTAALRPLPASALAPLLEHPSRRIRERAVAWLGACTGAAGTVGSGR